MIIKRLVGLLKHRAPKEQYFLELGSYFIRKGTGYKVGDAFEYQGKKASKTLFISNLYYNFKLNKITYKLDKNPILNRSEKKR
ncbi:hypothetical protein [Yeosuana marina]|uniref:hypothetical protein n=1 Tax=Yeosuana marina TaxID=1565536 RepID=UPI00141FC2A4|nr:hypothetical protein [Yeosuana marina]